MQITLSGRHMDITPAIREYMETKAAKLPRYYDRIQSITGTIDQRDHRIFQVEMHAEVDHADPFVATDESDDLYKSIDAVVNKLERQLTDHKEKLRNRKHMV